MKFNTWSLDPRHSCQFATGSHIIALYRHQLFNKNTGSKDSYFSSLNLLLNQHIEHIFLLRFIYFIDYNTQKNAFKNKSNS
ncbi:DUF5916 domain-containing protein [Flavivirga amylovorans]|uniref:DUF5916 domain-containing protein n=1 Tax=Flavivirga amylovorans TaxID=870486 RepID=UPI00349E773A